MFRLDTNQINQENELIVTPQPLVQPRPLPDEPRVAVAVDEQKIAVDALSNIATSGLTDIASVPADINAAFIVAFQQFYESLSDARERGNFLSVLFLKNRDELAAKFGTMDGRLFNYLLQILDDRFFYSRILTLVQPTLAECARKNWNTIVEDLNYFFRSIPEIESLQPYVLIDEVSSEEADEKLEGSNRLHAPKVDTISMEDKRRLLVDLLAEVNPDAKEKVTASMVDLSYMPRLKSLGDYRHEENLRHPLSAEEYETCLRAGVDLPQFLILTIGMLQSFMRNNPHASINITINKFLKQLSLDFLFLKYRKCRDDIQEFFLAFQARSYPSFFATDQLPIDSSLVLSTIDNLKPFQREHNDSRRYFITALSGFLSIPKFHSPALEDEHDLASIEKILSCFNPDVGTLDTPEKVEIAIATFCNSYKAKVPHARLKELEGCRANQMKDRGKREDIKLRADETSADQVGASFPSNMGALRALTPVPPESPYSLSTPTRNMVTDTIRPVAVKDEKKTGDLWSYQNDREYAAYVGSISGHMCKGLGLLEIYMREHVNDPDLNRDIRALYKQIFSVYIKNGYHGFMEMVDSLEDPYIQDIFNSYGVTFHPRDCFLDAAGSTALEYALTDTVGYTQHLVLKAAVNESIPRDNFGQRLVV